MGWDVMLVDSDGVPLPVPAHGVGSVLTVGGATEASCTVTYNYGWLIRAAAAMALTTEGLDASGTTLGADHPVAPHARSYPPPVTQLLWRVRRLALDGLDGLTGWWSGEALRLIATVLPPSQRQEDYWAPVPSNVRLVVDTLAAWADEHPDGVWFVS